MPWRHETLCPRCSRMYAVTGDALANLADLLADVLPSWVRHWTAAGAEKGYLLDILKTLDTLTAGADLSSGRQRFTAISEECMQELMPD